ncbi:MAG: SUMF1/EgtB/PvdO family nonheme iron enzyme, partial [Planctomycetota bacterium]
RVEELEVDLALAFAEAQKLLDAALLQEPRNAAARATLVELWRDRLADAERHRNKADIAYALVMIERYGDGPVPSAGTLRLTSDPPGADVFLYRNVDVDGVLTPTDEKHLGVTPLGPVTLPMGSYLCVLRKEGFRDTRHPVHITRECRWKADVRMGTDAEIGEDFIHVPAGPFTYGEGEKTTTKTLADFAIQRYPVTFLEYLEFLETLDGEEADERMPQTPGDGPYVERGEDGTYRVLPILVEGRARDWSLQAYGEGFDLRLPVIGISFDDAEAYCRWKNEITGMEWRLPTEEEREKATRGVDGRRFAWGDLEDASLGKCRNSREVPSQPEPVGAFATAESVYGVGDASGGVWDWTSSWEDERRSSRAVRGGSWLNPPVVLRAANRAALLPRERNSFVGMRCARSLG